MTQSQRARKVKAFVALAAFALGALLHVVLADVFRDSRSPYNARLERPSLDTPSSISAAKTAKQPSLVRALRSSSNGKDQLGTVPPSAADWRVAATAASPRPEQEFVAPTGFRIANRPRDPPFHAS